LTGFVSRDNGVDVSFENGARCVVDVLVGADGIHSTVRGKLFGDDAPLFAGCVAYRGLVPVSGLPIWGWNSGTSRGSARVAISCIISFRAAGC